MDQCRGLLDKLSGKTDPASVGLIDNLELKVMSLQQQFKELKDKNNALNGNTHKESGVGSSHENVGMGSHHPVDKYGGRGRGGRGGWAHGRGNRALDLRNPTSSTNTMDGQGVVNQSPGIFGNTTHSTTNSETLPAALTESAIVSIESESGQTVL